MADQLARTSGNRSAIAPSPNSNPFLANARPFHVRASRDGCRRPDSQTMGRPSSQLCHQADMPHTSFQRGSLTRTAAAACIVSTSHPVCRCRTAAAPASDSAGRYQAPPTPDRCRLRLSRGVTCTPTPGGLLQAQALASHPSAGCATPSGLTAVAPGALAYRGDTETMPISWAAASPPANVWPTDAVVAGAVGPPDVAHGGPIRRSARPHLGLMENSAVRLASQAVPSCTPPHVQGVHDECWC